MLTRSLVRLVKPGSYFYGFNETNPSLGYFNGTPAACALWGLNGNRVSRVISANEAFPLTDLSACSWNSLAGRRHSRRTC